MNDIAFTITIPDWLVNGSFWLGFGCGAGIVILLLLWVSRNFNPFG